MGILWLASYPKSGNTWVRAFLANLFANAPQPVHVNQLPRFAYGDYQAAHYEQLTGRKISEMTDPEINQLRPAVQRRIAAMRPETVMVKTHTAMTQLGDVPTILPDVTEGAVYIIRNPLDVAVSYAAHYGVSVEQSVEAMGDPGNGLVTHELNAFQYLGRWCDHVTGWVDAPGLKPHVIRYEDLCEAPEKTFAALAGFLRLPANPARLRKAIRFSSFRVLSDQERRDGFVERSQRADRFFRSGRAGDWRKTMPPGVADEVIATHRDVMDRFGYLRPDGSPRY